MRFRARLALVTLLILACSALPASAVEQQERPSAQVEEILITARRRVEPLQRTPVSVVALSEDELASRSVTNLRSLQNFVPNLTFAPSQNVGEAAGNIFIRGIGQEDFIAGAEPGVGLYVDGVYFATPVGTLMNLLDIARIEVLRGPQGTLFGKNTVGGAIQIISVAPQPERRSKVDAILGSYDQAELRVVLNDAVAEDLFMRFSLVSVNRGGYLRRLPPPSHAALAEADSRSEGGEHSLAGRLQARWVAREGLTADISLDASRKRNTQSATHVDAIDTRFGIFPNLNRLIREGRLPGPEITSAFLPQDFLVSYASGNNFTEQDIWGASAAVTQELASHAIKAIGAYRGSKSWIGTDTDGTYFNIFNTQFRDRQQQYSGELQLSGAYDPLVYTAGLFAFRSDAESFPNSGIGQNEILYTCNCFYPPGNRPPAFTPHRDLRNDNYAVYAQGTYGITETLSATLGARQSYEAKSVRAQSMLIDLNTFVPTNVVAGSGSNEDDWSSFTYRAGLEFQANPDLMLYGSVAKGFKSGGFNVRPVPNLPNLGLASFDPENALTYETGLRSEWFGRTVRLNATLFYTDYEDIQLRQQTLYDGITTTLIENAAKARIRGAELELMMHPFEYLSVSAAYGYIDPKYLDVGRVPGITLESSFQRTRSHSFVASLDYEMPLSFGSVALHGDYSYRSKEQFQLTATPYDQEGYGLLGARLSFRTMDERWLFALFGTNLTDKRYRSAGRGTLLTQSGMAHSNVGMPRQVGVQVVFRS